MAKEEIQRLREPTTWALLAVAATSVLSGVGDLFADQPFGVRAAQIAAQVLNPLVTALPAAAVALAVLVGQRLARAHLVAGAALAVQGLAAILGLVALVGCLTRPLRLLSVVAELALLAIAIYLCRLLAPVPRTPPRRSRPSRSAQSSRSSRRRSGPGYGQRTTPSAGTPTPTSPTEAYPGQATPPPAAPPAAPYPSPYADPYSAPAGPYPAERAGGPTPAAGDRQASWPPYGPGPEPTGHEPTIAVEPAGQPPVTSERGYASHAASPGGYDTPPPAPAPRPALPGSPAPDDDPYESLYRPRPTPGAAPYGAAPDPRHASRHQGGVGEQTQRMDPMEFYDDYDRSPRAGEGPASWYRDGGRRS